jgi:galactose mutarotase-like enzyme
MPALGGKIRDITLAGRQWLWHNPDIPFTMPAEGASFALAGNSGGFDDCLPTSSECLVPTWVQGIRSRQLPDHGELWSHQPQLTVTADERGPAATCTWTGTALPYRFARTVTVHRDESVEFTYALTNAGTNRMPFVWAAHPVLPLTEHTRIVLPDGARTRVGTQVGIPIGRAGAEHRWPRLRAGSILLDVSRPATTQKEDFSCKLFVDLPKTEIVIAVEEEHVRLEMHVNGNSLRQAGLRIDRRGWSAHAAKRWSVPLLPLKPARPHANLVFGPCLGAPDSLSDALGAWDDAHWVEPGATTRWSMVWRGVPIEPRDGA